MIRLAASDGLLPLLYIINNIITLLHYIIVSHIHIIIIITSISTIITISTTIIIRIIAYHYYHYSVGWVAPVPGKRLLVIMICIYD